VFEADQVYDYLKSRMPGLVRLEAGMGFDCCGALMVQSNTHADACQACHA